MGELQTGESTVLGAHLIYVLVRGDGARRTGLAPSGIGIGTRAATDDEGQREHGQRQRGAAIRPSFDHIDCMPTPGLQRGEFHRADAQMLSECPRCRVAVRRWSWRGAKVD